jgi:error-prone DNA polymerase
MSMLPRLQPRCFYDLVIEVAIVRPGPIQGDMVHPYLRRRHGIEPVTYPSEALRAVLHKTLGVPLFQEQAMKIAIVAAGFTPDEADKLRRAMATFRHVGTIHTFREKFIAGMVGNGYQLAFAERCFGQIEGFGEYGFPESHAASFALLVYVSSWIKQHYPEAFCAAILNSQPMGFYAPAQLVRDAREHGVEVRHPDINHSDWHCTLEDSPSPRPRRDPPPPCGEGLGVGGIPTGDVLPSPPPCTSPTSCRRRASGTMGEGTTKEREQCAIRLGLRLVRGAPEEVTKAIVAARGPGYPDIPSIWARSGAPASVMERLADADAFRSIGLDRRAAET